MKPKDLKKTVSAKKASLGHVLKKNKKIKVTVKKAAGELTLVNEILKQKKPKSGNAAPDRSYVTTGCI